MTTYLIEESCQRHPAFPLSIAVDAALRDVVGCAIDTRTVLHEWPLSRVELLTAPSGERFVYKVMIADFVEPEFYDHLRSPLLAAHRNLGLAGGCKHLLLEWVSSGGQPTEPEWPHKVLTLIDKHLSDGIGDAPVYYNLADFRLWVEFAEGTATACRSLIDSAVIAIPPELVDAAEAWSHSPAVKALFDAPPVLFHGDLKPENVLTTPTGATIILDWQRPGRGPAGIDAATWLAAVDPTAHGRLPPAIRSIPHFLRLAWAVECQTRLWPGGVYSSWIRDALQALRQPGE